MMPARWLSASRLLHPAKHHAVLEAISQRFGNLRAIFLHGGLSWCVIFNVLQVLVYGKVINQASNPIV